MRAGEKKILVSPKKEKRTLVSKCSVRFNKELIFNLTSTCYGNGWNFLRPWAELWVLTGRLTKPDENVHSGALSESNSQFESCLEKAALVVE